MTKRRFSMLLVTFVVMSVATSASAIVRRSSVATLSTGGGGASSFCVANGTILVTHQCLRAGGYNSCAIGHTEITGPATLRVGPGTHSLPSGCYQHTIAGTTVMGSAVAQSTVWYNSAD